MINEDETLPSAGSVPTSPPAQPPSSSIQKTQVEANESSQGKKKLILVSGVPHAGLKTMTSLVFSDKLAYQADPDIPRSITFCNYHLVFLSNKNLSLFKGFDKSSGMVFLIDLTKEVGPQFEALANLLTEILNRNDTTKFELFIILTNSDRARQNRDEIIGSYNSAAESFKDISPILQLHSPLFSSIFEPSPFEAWRKILFALLPPLQNVLNSFDHFNRLLDFKELLVCDKYLNIVLETKGLQLDKAIFITDTMGPLLRSLGSEENCRGSLQFGGKTIVIGSFGPHAWIIAALSFKENEELFFLNLETLNELAFGLPRPSWPESGKVSNDSATAK